MTAALHTNDGGGRRLRAVWSSGDVSSPSGALTPVSVDAGCILIDHEDATLEFLRADGTRLRTFHLNAEAVRCIRLQGRDLVVLTTTSAEITDAETRVFRRRWPRPSDAVRLGDVQDGIAVLVAGTRTCLQRLAAARRVVNDAPGSGRVLAQLEPSGLFYSYRADDAKYPGCVVFVPFDRLALR